MSDFERPNSRSMAVRLNHQKESSEGLSASTWPGATKPARVARPWFAGRSRAGAMGTRGSARGVGLGEVARQ